MALKPPLNWACTVARGGSLRDLVSWKVGGGEGEGWENREEEGKEEEKREK